jgi:hypothetical protein
MISNLLHFFQSSKTPQNIYFQYVLLWTLEFWVIELLFGFLTDKNYIRYQQMAPISHHLQPRFQGDGPNRPTVMQCQAARPKSFQQNGT